LKNDEALKREMAFEEKLRSLMAEYGKSLKHIIAILDPQTHTSLIKPVTASGRRARQAKIYRNPHSGEVVETKGGNHKILKQWKEQYGADAVESWLQK
jgi:hypothetical protein